MLDFKKIITLILLTINISTITVFAEVNNETLNIISSENENIISNGYEISNQFKILVNKNEINLNNGTLVFKERTYLPIRELSKFLDANIDYNPEYKISILTKNNITIEIPQNRTKATVTKNNITNVLNMDNDSNIQSLVLDGVTYLPLRFIAENLGYDILYNAKTKIIELNEKIIENTTKATTQKLMATTSKESTTNHITEKPTETSSKEINKNINKELTTNNIDIKTLYIGNKDNFKLHLSSCRYVKQILPENISQFETKEEAISTGYNDFCKVCLK